MNHDRSRGHIEAIHVAATSGADLVEIEAANLIAGRGIEGDRYCTIRNEAQISLVEAEQIEAFTRDAALGFAPRHTRRNIVTRGIGLNALVGQRFSIGEVRLLGVELAEPCAYLAGRLIEQFNLGDIEPKQIVSGLVHRGGLYASILRGGTIRPGDPIRVEV